MTGDGSGDGQLVYSTVEGEQIVLQDTDDVDTHVHQELAAVAEAEAAAAEAQMVIDKTIDEVIHIISFLHV